MFKSLKTLFIAHFFLLMTLGLSGCGAKYADHTVKPHQLASGEKAIIITKAGHKYKGWILKGETPVTFAIAKADERYPDKKQRHAYFVQPHKSWFSIFPETSHQVLMVDPGVYVLENIKYTMGDTDYYTLLDGLNPGTESFVYGGFSVKPGEIVYLGDIDVDMSPKPGKGNFFQNLISTPELGMNITLTDDYEKAVQALHKKHPELIGQPVKKEFVNLKGALSQYMKK